MEETHPDLPHGRSLNAALKRGQTLFDRGLYREAHDALEEEWRRRLGGAKLLLQGLTQLCAACHKIKSGADPKAGALYLLEKGLEKTMKAAPLLPADRAQALEKTIKRTIAAIERGEKPPPPGLAWA